MALPVDPRLLTRAQWWTRAVCYVLAGLGALVLVGWLFQIELLTSLLHPSRVAMNPLTAIEFIMAAAALWHLRSDDAPAAYRQRGVWIACAMVVLALLTLLDNALVIPQVDRLLFASRVGTNRMAPNTATAMVATGLALASLDCNSGLRQPEAHPEGA